MFENMFSYNRQSEEGRGWPLCGCSTLSNGDFLFHLLYLYLFGDLFWPTSSAIIFIIFLRNFPILFALFPARLVQSRNHHSTIGPSSAPFRDRRERNEIYQNDFPLRSLCWSPSTIIAGQRPQLSGTGRDGAGQQQASGRVPRLTKRSRKDMARLLLSWRLRIGAEMRTARHM